MRIGVFLMLNAELLKSGCGCCGPKGGVGNGGTYGVPSECDGGCYSYVCVLMDFFCANTTGENPQPNLCEPYEYVVSGNFASCVTDPEQLPEGVSKTCQYYLCYRDNAGMLYVTYYADGGIRFQIAGCAELSGDSGKLYAYNWTDTTSTPGCYYAYAIYFSATQADQPGAHGGWAGPSSCTECAAPTSATFTTEITETACCQDFADWWVTNGAYVMACLVGAVTLNKCADFDWGCEEIVDPGNTPCLCHCYQKTGLCDYYGDTYTGENVYCWQGAGIDVNVWGGRCGLQFSSMLTWYNSGVTDEAILLECRSSMIRSKDCTFPTITGVLRCKFCGKQIGTWKVEFNA